MIVASIDFCTATDLDALYEIEAECFAAPWHKSILREELRAGMGPYVYLKAEMKGSIAGYTVFNCEDRILHLLRLGVAKKYRRFGLATQLLAAAEEIACYKKCSRIKLEVRASNPEAALFYESFGLRLLSRLNRFYTDGETALIYGGHFPLKFLKIDP